VFRWLVRPSSAAREASLRQHLEQGCLWRQQLEAYAPVPGRPLPPLATGERLRRRGASRSLLPKPATWLNSARSPHLPRMAPGRRCGGQVSGPWPPNRPAQPTGAKSLLGRAPAAKIRCRRRPRQSRRRPARRSRGRGDCRLKRPMTRPVLPRALLVGGSERQLLKLSAERPLPARRPAAARHRATGQEYSPSRTDLSPFTVFRDPTRFRNGKGKRGGHL
jgi:hypothetical protein